jgi:hypothetical protein
MILAVNAGPSVLSWSASGLDVFVRGVGQIMLDREYNRAKWPLSWDQAGSRVTGS